jgi:hypothetical protein
MITSLFQFIGMGDDILILYDEEIVKKWRIPQWLNVL